MPATVPRLARRPDVQAVALAALGALLWLALAPRTPDLAAQSYRVALFERFGFTVWDNGWYAGHYLPAYSLLFPGLGSLVGMRVVGALSAVAATGCFAALAGRHFGPRARPGILWFGLASVSDLAIGRLTYSLAAALGLGALAALQRRRVAVGAVLAALCAAAAPLAGVFLAFAGLIVCAGAPSLRRATAIVIGPALVVMAGLALAFGEGGRQPFGGRILAVAIVMTAVFVATMPARERVLQLGGIAFAAMTVLAFVLSTPLGDNVTRLAAVFMGPVALCALAVRPPPRGRVAGLAAVGLVGLAAYQWYAPVREMRKGAGDPLARASAYGGVVRFLESHRIPLGRLEVPFTTSHWENAVLALRFPLARGWEKQLDTRYDALFYHREHPLAPGIYEAWLRSLGVRYVAVPAVSLDPAGRQEAAVIRSRPAFLAPVWADRRWRVFAVVRPSALASGPARVTELGSQSFRISFLRPATSLVRVRFTPYWQADHGCVARGPQGFTSVTAPEGGNLRVGIGFSVGRIGDGGRRCAG
jgi:hypothetical protein